MRVSLKEDYFSLSKPKEKYGSKGDELEVISIHDDILIVKNIHTGECFSVPDSNCLFSINHLNTNK